MVLDGHTEQLFYCRFDGLDPGVAEFNDFTGIGANHVIVLLRTVGFFKLRHVFSELVLADQVAGQQQFNGIVQGCPGNTVILIFHLDIQRLHVKVTGIIVYFSQDRIPFGSFAVPVLLHIS